MKIIDCAMSTAITIAGIATIIMLAAVVPVCLFLITSSSFDLIRVIISGLIYVTSIITATSIGFNLYNLRNKEKYNG